MGQVMELWLFVTWFCYQLIAKPGNKTAPVLWPEPYSFLSGMTCAVVSEYCWQYHAEWEVNYTQVSSTAIIILINKLKNDFFVNMAYGNLFTQRLLLSDKCWGKDTETYAFPTDDLNSSVKTQVIIQSLQVSLVSVAPDDRLPFHSIRKESYCHSH